MSKTRTYTGGCHCGAVRFECEAEIERAIACNCSICTKRGLLLAFTGGDRFRLLAGEDALADYRFHKHKVAHLFCKSCGVESFARGQGADGAATIALNLRCLNGLDLDAIPRRAFDGAKL